MMLNRSSFSIGRYLRYQCRRYSWLMVVFGILMLISGPFINYVGLKRTLLDDSSAEMIKSLQDSVCYGITFIPEYFFAGFLGIVFALILCSYLHNKNKSNFYHFLPVSRKQWLTSQLLAGFTFFTILNGLCFILQIGVYANLLGFSGLNLSYLGLHFLQVELFFMTSFAISMLAGFLVANILAHVAMIAILQFGIPVFALILECLMHTFYSSYVSSGILDRMFFFSLPAGFYNYANDVLAHGNPDTLYPPYMGNTMIITMLVVTILAIALSYILYKYRKMERASETLAFNWVKLPLKLFLQVIFSLSFGLLLFATFERTLNLFIGTIIGAIVFHLFFEMAINRDVRAMIKPRYWISTGIILALSLGAAYGMDRDVCGYDSFIPSEDAIGKVSISSMYDYIDGTTDRDFVSLDEKGKENVIKIAELGVKNLENQSVDSPNAMPSVYLGYNYSAGFSSSRSYVVEQKPFTELFAKIYDDPTYRQSVVDLIFNKKPIVEIGLEAALTEGVNYKIGPKNPEDLKLILAALKKDMGNRKFSNTQTSPVGYLQLNYNTPGHRHTERRVPVFESDANTVKVLHEINARNDWNHFFLEDSVGEVKRIEVHNNETGDVEKNITNPEEIREMVMKKGLRTDIAHRQGKYSMILYNERNDEMTTITYD